MAIRLGASSYSYQDEYALGLMTLEDTMAALSAAGGTGYEAVSGQRFYRRMEICGHR